jgi:hypothetical protein
MICYSKINRLSIDQSQWGSATHKNITFSLQAGSVHNQILNHHAAVAVGPSHDAHHTLVLNSYLKTHQSYCLNGNVCNHIAAVVAAASGHDARHHSAEFATIAAKVFLSQGIPVHLFSTIVPTPYVAAAVPLLGCAAGVMVTASHNTKEYNGYKVRGSKFKIIQNYSKNSQK